MKNPVIEQDFLIRFKNMMKRITIFSALSIIAVICFFTLILGSKNCDGCYSALAMSMKFSACGLIIIIGSIYFKSQYLKTEGIIFNLESEPIKKTDEAVDGVSFLGKGVLEGEDNKTINSPYTNTPCLYFHSIKEKLVRQGKSARWEIVENVAHFTPFYLKDKRGRLKIDLTDVDYDFSKYAIPLQKELSSHTQNSEIECDILLKKATYNEKEGPFGFLVQTKYRRSEFVLLPGSAVFVCGMIVKRGNELILREDKNYPLIISKKDRDQYVEDFYKGKNLVYLSHFLIMTGYTLFLLSLNYIFEWSRSLVLSIIVFGNFAILGSAIFSLYNRIVSLKNRAFNAKSNIEIDLKRRADLIPNLIEAVKRYSAHEKEIQEIIAESRAQIMLSGEIRGEKSPIISSLVLIVERYPDLKSSEHFQALIKRLADTEDRIAYSREFYNRSVRKYNTLIGQFPFLMVARFCKMKPMDFVCISRGINVGPYS